MKKLILIFLCFLTLSISAQNKFDYAVKFMTVAQNDANTKMLSINGAGLQQYVDKSSIISGLALDSNVVHKSGAENIFGVKTFFDTPVLKLQLTLKSVLDNNFQLSAADENFSVFDDLNSAYILRATTGQISNETIANDLAVLDFTNITSNRGYVFMDTSGTVPLIGTVAPSSSSDVGVTGEIRITSTFIYWCIAPNTWIRAAGATWP